MTPRTLFFVIFLFAFAPFSAGVEEGLKIHDLSSPDRHLEHFLFHENYFDSDSRDDARNSDISGAKRASQRDDFDDDGGEKLRPIFKGLDTFDAKDSGGASEGRSEASFRAKAERGPIRANSHPNDYDKRTKRDVSSFLRDLFRG